MDLATLLSDDPVNRLTALLVFVVTMFAVAAVAIVLIRLATRRRDRRSDSAGHDQSWSPEWAADLRASEHAEHRALGGLPAPTTTLPGQGTTPMDPDPDPASTPTNAVEQEPPRTTAEALLQRLRNEAGANPHTAQATDTHGSKTHEDTPSESAPSSVGSPFGDTQWDAELAPGDAPLDADWFAEVTGTRPSH